MQLIDSHSHFDDASFDADRDLAYRLAHQVGVREQVVPAVTAAAWPKLKAVCTSYPGLYPAYGLHPMLLNEHRAQHLDDLAGWVGRERPVAVGECGLDFFVPDLDPQAQEQYFLGQLRIARDARIPAIIHARRAVDQVIKCLRRVPLVGAVVHSFSGSEQQARRLLDLGCYLGLGGPLTYPRAQRLRRLARNLPLERLLLETDSPDQPGIEHRGERNQPAYLVEVLETLALLRDEDPRRIADITRRNAQTLFRLPQ